MSINTSVAAIIILAELLGACVLIRRGTVAAAVLIAGLLALFAALATVVHLGWMAGFDAAVASWFDTHRSHRLDVAAPALFDAMTPATFAAVALVCGALFAWRARSPIAATGVTGGLIAGVAAEHALKALVERGPWTPAELHFIPERLHGVGLHSFPSGHVIGTAVLLGMVAVHVRGGCRRAVRAVLAVAVVAGVLLVGFAVLYLGVHCGSDVLGGLVLGAALVVLGSVWFRWTYSRLDLAGNDRRFGEYEDAGSPR